MSTQGPKPKQESYEAAEAAVEASRGTTVLWYLATQAKAGKPGAAELLEKAARSLDIVTMDSRLKTP